MRRALQGAFTLRCRACIVETKIIAARSSVSSFHRHAPLTIWTSDNDGGGAANGVETDAIFKLGNQRGVILAVAWKHTFTSDLIVMTPTVESLVRMIAVHNLYISVCVIRMQYVLISGGAIAR